MWWHEVWLRHIPEDGTIHCHSRENLKSYFYHSFVSDVNNF
jgi:hypothetical protein